MITGAVHPLLVGHVIPAKGAYGAASEAPQVTAQQEAAVRDRPARGRRGYNKLFADLLTSSRWIGSSSDEKAVLTVLLALKDAEGFVAASIPGLANAAQVSVEVAQKMIDKLKSPDRFSRSKKYEGRSLEEVEGGFRFLNHKEYRDWREQVALPASGRQKDQIKSEQKTTTTTTTDRAGDAIGQADPIPELSVSEVKIYSSLKGRIGRLFLILREWASIAADKGESDFGVSQSYLEKMLQCKRQSVAEMLEKLVSLEVIKMTAEHKPKLSPARYRWAVETTIPSAPPESDADEESVF
jgi:hypothetical protein